MVDGNDIKCRSNQSSNHTYKLILFWFYHWLHKPAMYDCPFSIMFLKCGVSISIHQVGWEGGRGDESEKVSHSLNYQLIIPGPRRPRGTHILYTSRLKTVIIVHATYKQDFTKRCGGGSCVYIAKKQHRIFTYDFYQLLPDLLESMSRSKKFAFN